MTCGCASKAKDPKSLLFTRSATCAACIAGYNVNPMLQANCPNSGLPVSLYVAGKPCPEAKHPPADNIVHWLGIRWYGVPWPLRVYWWSVIGQHVPYERWMRSFHGCGCVKRLKDWWASLGF